VEKARDALEKFYHDAGYPAVLVNYRNRPSRAALSNYSDREPDRAVKISGNRYFTSEKIMRDMPSFNPGEILYMPKSSAGNRPFKQESGFQGGTRHDARKGTGTIDVELKVDDRFSPAREAWN